MYGESQFYTPYEQDVPYGMSHNMPEPMGIMASNFQGFPNYGSTYSNNFQTQAPSYKKGGHVGFREALERARMSGEGRDKILAHISPEEAEELALTRGGDINPVTGLPQFDWMDRIHDVIDRYGEPASNFLGRTLAAAAGNMFGGPIGATLAASAAGAALEGNRERPNYGRGALMGGLHGAVQGFGGPMVGGAMGVNPSGAAGTLLGMNGAARGLGALGSLGAASRAAPSAGRAAAMQGLARTGASQMGPVGSGAQSAGGSGLLGSLFGGGGEGGGLLGGGLLNNALLGTAILGALNARYETPRERSASEYMSEHGPRWNASDMPREIRPYERSLRYFNPNAYSPGFNPEQLYFSGHGYDQPMRLAEGGHLFEGKGGGQDDTIPKNLPQGGYVIDASTMSDLGDGNPEMGNKNLSHGLSSLSHHKNYKKGGVPHGTIRAKVSSKERFISPEEVTTLGKGSNEKGAMMLKNMVKNVRKHKRSSDKSLPPKAKSVQQYMRGH